LAGPSTRRTHSDHPHSPPQHTRPHTHITSAGPAASVLMTRIKQARRAGRSMKHGRVTRNCCAQVCVPTTAPSRDTPPPPPPAAAATHPSIHPSIHPPTDRAEAEVAVEGKAKEDRPLLCAAAGCCRTRTDGRDISDDQKSPALARSLVFDGLRSWPGGLRAQRNSVPAVQVPVGLFLPFLGRGSVYGIVFYG